jgi:hypothetical protein
MHAFSGGSDWGCGGHHEVEYTVVFIKYTAALVGSHADYCRLLQQEPPTERSIPDVHSRSFDFQLVKTGIIHSISSSFRNDNSCHLHISKNG